jgi:Fe2+ or Zn2+ uptake regulation protein
LLRFQNEPVASVLRKRGLRVTPQRLAVWAAFEDGEAGHLSADEVLRRARHIVPEVSRATVYNALSQFVAAGLLSPIERTSSQLYDPNLAPHHHFHCRLCRRLFDVHPHGSDQLALAEREYVVEQTSVIFEGLCPSCAADR